MTEIDDFFLVGPKKGIETFAVGKSEAMPFECFLRRSIRAQEYPHSPCLKIAPKVKKRYVIIFIMKCQMKYPEIPS